MNILEPLRCEICSKLCIGDKNLAFENKTIFWKENSCSLKKNVLPQDDHQNSFYFY